MGEHLLGVHQLAEAFPDAKVVTIHRDEVSVYKSLLMLQHMTRSMAIPDESKSTDRTVDAAQLQLCAQQRGLAAMPSVNVTSKALYFQDVIGQPIDVLKEVVAFAGLPWNAAKEATAQAAVVAQRLRKKKMGGKITYDMEAFGLTEDKIRERLSRCSSHAAQELTTRISLEETREADAKSFELIGRPKVCNGTLSSTSKANLSSALQIPIPAANGTAYLGNSSSHVVSFTPFQKATWLETAFAHQQSNDETLFILTRNETPSDASTVVTQNATPTASKVSVDLALADVKHIVTHMAQASAKPR